ncbi:MAG TPA: ABC transporter permease [Thermoanaerobaculia bacterium]|jgi:ABC-2 type transport system permease protein
MIATDVHDDVEPVAYAPLAETRPFYWCVRRELWENRYLYIAPLAVAAVVLFATFVMTVTTPMRMRGQDPARVAAAVVRPLQTAPAPIMFCTLVVGLFYCLDALNGERRDRSILFWKSLPVSDRTTVLAKAGIPLVLLPAFAYVLSVLAQLVLLFASSLTILSPTIGRRFFEGLLIMFYGLAVHALWFAPVYGWLLLISAWSRRSVLLWAVLPLLAVSAVERILFGSSLFMAMLQYRMTGAMREAFTFSRTTGGNIDRLTQLTPANFFARPGLWLGLLFAAACIAAAIRLRRRREPV